jgi:ECF transporter S component (folate family)
LLKYLSNVLSQAVPLSFKISLSYVGWFAAAIISGPTGGFGVAVISDLLGQLILSTGGAPNPILLAGNGIATFVFGLVYHYLPILKNRGIFGKSVRAVIAAITFAIVGTMGLNTFGLWLYYFRSADYLAYLATRLIQLIMWGANTVLIVALLPAINALKLEYVQHKTVKFESEKD